MIKRIVTLLLFSWGCHMLNAQQHSLKTYANTLFLYSIPASKPFDYEERIVNFNGITGAYRIVNERSFFHQLEARLGIKKVNQLNGSFERLSTHLRYEFGKYLPRKLFNTIEVFFSASIRFSYLNEKIEVPSYDTFPIELNTSGIHLSIAAGFEYDITDRLYLEMGISVNDVIIGVESRYKDNPAFTERQKQFGGYFLDALNERSLRLGIGYNIWPKKEKG